MEIPESEYFKIGGRSFVSAQAVADAIGVSRQTLWRWRSERRIPQGHRLRNRKLLFSQGDVEQIREYAHRLEPVDLSADPNQLNLFGKKS